jgi:hypothetical protein
MAPVHSLVSQGTSLHHFFLQDIDSPCANVMVCSKREYTMSNRREPGNLFGCMNQVDIELIYRMKLRISIVNIIVRCHGAIDMP